MADEALDPGAEMPHFTVVPVDDKHRADYDDLEGISRVDYREKGQRSCDPYDTVSSDGKSLTRSADGGSYFSI